MTQHMIINPSIKLAPPTIQAPLSQNEIDAWEAETDRLLGITSPAEPQTASSQPASNPRPAYPFC